jgi:hypothetical protein
MKIFEFQVFGFPLQGTDISLLPTISNTVTKIIVDGQLIIIRNGVQYDITGQIVN